MPVPVRSYTHALTPQQVPQLRAVLAGRGFDFEERPYMHYYACQGKLSVSVYEKGPKVLVQGKETEDFVRFILEPEILGEAKLGYEDVLHPDRYEAHFGIDESGKGDFFGPLVIAGVFVDDRIARALLESGATDSKKITSDARMRAVAGAVKRIPGILYRSIVIGPTRYNQLIEKMGNVNRLLAWGHARVIEELATLRPDCPRALSDQFANPGLIQRALMENGRKLKLEQRTKAESDPAVAAASIIAREKFIDWMDTHGKPHGIASLPRGASAQVKQIAAGLVKDHGPDILRELTKIHFKTAGEIAPQFRKPANSVKNTEPSDLR